MESEGELEGFDLSKDRLLFLKGEFPSESPWSEASKEILIAMMGSNAMYLMDKYEIAEADMKQLLTNAAMFLEFVLRDRDGSVKEARKEAIINEALYLKISFLLPPN